MTTDPFSSTEVMVGRVGELFENHGAFVDKYTCDKYRFMTVEQFKNEVVPTLESSETSGDFYHYVIRDLSQNRILTIEPDGVHEFHVKDMRQMFSTEFIRYIIENNKNKEDRELLNLDLNSSAPVIRYKEFSNSLEVVLKIPSLKMLFHHEIYPALNIPIYLPPLLYKVRLNKISNVPETTFVCALVEDSILSENIVLGDLALPNIYSASSNFAICTGSTRFRSNVEFDKMTATMAANKAFELFLSSNFNFDLFLVGRLPSNLFSEFEKKLSSCSEIQLKQIEKMFNSIPEALTRKSFKFKDWLGKKPLEKESLDKGHYLAMLLWCLNEKKGYENLKWLKVASSTML